MLRAALGLEPDTEARTIVASPHLPNALRELELNGCPAFDKAFQVVVNGGRAQVRPVAAERRRTSPRPEPQPLPGPNRRAGRWSR